MMDLTGGRWKGKKKGHSGGRETPLQARAGAGGGGRVQVRLGADKISIQSCRELNAFLLTVHPASTVSPEVQVKKGVTLRLSECI